MEGLFMTGALKLWAASLVAAFTVTCAHAAEPTPAPPPPPPPEPLFFVHVGALGVFTLPNAQPEGGGVFGVLGGSGATLTNVAIRPNYTLGLEAGYFITPNIALALSAGVPPLIHIKAENLNLTPLLGTNLLGSARYGPLALLLQYHFPSFGAIQPYFGVGGAYVVQFANISDGILRNFSIDNNFAFVLQGGVDTLGSLDPWVVSAGVTFKY
jgi:outer membrane protein